MRQFLRPIEDETKFTAAGDYVEIRPYIAPDGFEWVTGEPPESATPYVDLSPLDRLEEIISQGQIAMSEAPLPLDLQKEIYDLEVFINNYYRRGASLLIVASIESFEIPPERLDVTEGQRAQVDALKAQMLAVFS